MNIRMLQHLFMVYTVYSNCFCLLLNDWLAVSAGNHHTLSLFRDEYNFQKWPAKCKISFMVD